MKTFAAATLCAFASANLEGKFMQWISEHGRSYGTIEEFKFRMAEFAKVDSIIEEHMAKNDASYELGHNKFSDWTRAEFKKTLGYRANTVAFEETMAAPVNVTYPATVDWVTAGAVTPVKDQAQCGSCWAFSSTGAMEGMWKIFHGALTSLSEEQLVQCVNLCYGCNGGNTGLVFGYYAKNNYMYGEAAYPYTSGTGTTGTCKYPASGKTTTKTTGSTSVTPNSVADMKTALAQQPVSIAIEADQYQFSAYKSGIFDNTSCGTSLDHAVLLVGYGSQDGQEYYLMKNSWGTSWGESGYMKMAIIGNGPGICGCQMQPNYPSH
jgi:C1A family cysteine protease